MALHKHHIARVCGGEKSFIYKALEWQQIAGCVPIAALL